MLLVLALAIVGALAQPVRAGRAQLFHDNWGVPHIFAEDRASGSYAYGWSTAEDHGELCLSLYAAARCRTAQYYGGPAGGALKVLTDQFLLSFGVRKLGEQYYSTATDFSREIFDSFAAGFTDYVTQHRERFSAEGLAVVDDPMYGGIVGQDVAAHSAFDLQLFVSTSVFGRLFSTLDSFGDLSAAQQRNASRIDPTWFMRDHLESRDARGDFDFMKYENGDWRPAGDPHAMGRLGSNAMAAVREGGGSVLHINPHLVWNVQDLPFQSFDGSAMTFYEAHMEIEGDIAAYGCSLVGIPVLNIAFTKASGWAHTVNSQTAYSLYRLTVRAVGLPPDLGEWQYLMDGEWVPFEVESFVVENRGAESTTHNVLTSNYGPVLLLDIGSNTAVVYRYAGHVFGVEQQKPLLTLEQLWQQLQATNVDEFKAAVAMQQMPMFTYIYADHNGDMFYQSNR
jgi:acyl-homoserine-lactone acylase